MANSKGPSSIRNVLYSGKNSILPPKCPFPSISPSYIEYAPSIIQKGTPKPREGNLHHQRTSSESFLMDEQPSWLDDLLNEPDTTVYKGGHRRSSSDSFTSSAYVDAANVANSGYIVQDPNKFRNLLPVPSWGSQLNYRGDACRTACFADPNAPSKHKSRARDASPNKIIHPSGIPSPRENAILQNSESLYSPQEDDLGDAWHTACYADPNALSKHRNRKRDASPNKITHPSGIPVPRENNIHQNSESLYPPQEDERAQSPATVKHDAVESDPADSKCSAEKESSLAMISVSETDTKRAKQQFAQRSRVRKLQYIAELERTVQALQVDGSVVSAELEFLNQQNLILSMENKALKQQLESLAQEHLIKYLEHEVLERERGRLRALYQQRQQLALPQLQKPLYSGHRLTKSVDFDKQFANLSMKE
nr:Basic-leucine zipper transcription factor family protein isoform 1 [Ipomoea batatas]GME17013.1 Basic-leucine zipper transcription factor family protein isoform 1 [Ipomoea batatas]